MKQNTRDVELENYMFDNSLMVWDDQWTGIAPYAGGAGDTVYLIRVDETVVEWSHWFVNEFNITDPELDRNIGELMFIAYEPSGPSIRKRALSTVIRNMEADLNILKELEDK